jgi:hypothetical protein
MKNHLLPTTFNMLPLSKINIQPSYKARLIACQANPATLRYFFESKEPFFYVDSLQAIAADSYNITGGEEPLNFAGIKTQLFQLALTKPMPLELNLDEMLLPAGRYDVLGYEAAPADPYAPTVPWPYWNEPYIVDGVRVFEFWIDSTYPVLPSMTYTGHISIDGDGEIEANIIGQTSAAQLLNTWGEWLKEQLVARPEIDADDITYKVEGTKLTLKYAAHLPASTMNMYGLADPSTWDVMKPVFALIYVKQ